MDLRKYENNKSMPSGDAAQASIYIYFLMTNFPKAFMSLGGPFGSSQFVLIVCFARVYFHCHYIGDVLAGCFIGTIVGAIIFKIGLKSILKGLYLSISS